MQPVHKPAMVNEVVAYLGPLAGKTILDMTVGPGGHARHLLARGAFVIGLDRDPEALQLAANNLAEFSGQFMLLHGRMSQAKQLLEQQGVHEVDGCLIDAGISMDQMADETRGFSVHSNWPLDMRMDRSNPRAPTAYDIVNRYLENDLAELFRIIGKGREARRVAARIVAARQRKPIQTTAELAALIAATVAKRKPVRATDAAPYIMAIRAAVNAELAELQAGVEAASCLLSPKGTLVTLTWNSAEHHVSKQALRRLAAPCQCPPALPCVCGKRPVLRLLTRKPLYPSHEEVQNNPACRSVRLQAAQKL